MNRVAGLVEKAFTQPAPLRKPVQFVGDCRWNIDKFDAVIDGGGKTGTGQASTELEACEKAFADWRRKVFGG